MRHYARIVKTLAAIAAFTAVTAQAETSVTCNNQSGFIQTVYAEGVLCSDYGFINAVSVWKHEKTGVTVTMKYLDKNNKMLFINSMGILNNDFSFSTVQSYKEIPTNDVNVRFDDYVAAKANPALTKKLKRYEEGFTVFAQVKILPNKDIRLNAAMNELKMQGSTITTTQWRENKVMVQNKPYTFTVDGNTLEITVKEAIE